MKHILRVLLPLIAIFIFISLYYTRSDEIKPMEKYPVWMKDAKGVQTDQTSGMCFIGLKDNVKIFIAADDIGKINRISVDESKTQPELTIEPIIFSDEIKTLFSKFKKTDMEDIYFDSLNNKLLLSIEGHEYSSKDPEIYKKKEGIYEITFNKDALTFDTLLTIKRLNLPQDVYAHTFDNVAFEGFSETAKYYFLGLENFQTPNNEFTDSTVIYIVNRSNNELKSIGTRDLKISSVCGLYSKDDYNLYGIDRNKRSIFHIKFNPDFTINSCNLKNISLPIPDYPDIDKIIGTAPESITFDYDDNIFITIDPWKDFYLPDITERKRISKEEMENFRKFVPIMYKFKNPF